MQRNMLRWAGAAIVGLTVLGLGVYFAMVGLDRADKTASVIGAFIGLTGLAVTAYGTMPARRAAASWTEGEPPPGAVHNEIHGGTINGSVTQAGTVSGPIIIGRPPEPTADPASPDEGP